MSDHYDSFLNICGDDKASERLRAAVEEMLAGGYDIPLYVNGEEMESGFNSCDEEFMKALCKKKFPDTLLIADFKEGARPYREYWYNGKVQTVWPTIDAPDYQKLGIPERAQIDFADEGEFMAQAHDTPKGTLYPRSFADEQKKGYAICLNGVEVVRIGYSKEAKDLLMFAPRPTQLCPAYAGLGEMLPPEDYIATEAELKALLALRYLGADFITRNEWGGIVSVPRLENNLPQTSPIPVPDSDTMLPFVKSGEKVAISLILGRHYKAAARERPIKDENIIKIDGNITVTGVQTPGGLLTAHISNAPYYPNISIRCDNVEVARVEYCAENFRVQTCAYGDENMESCLEETEQGIIPYIPTAKGK